jgi:hypothetical protein
MNDVLANCSEEDLSYINIPSSKTYHNSGHYPSIALPLRTGNILHLCYEPNSNAVYRFVTMVY